MNVKEKIIDISDKILNALIEFRNEHPDFTCSLRSRDSVMSDEVRLANGQWFQGSDYLFVPLFKKGDTARKIKTLGFVLVFNEDASIKNNYIEISFKKGSEQQSDQSFHKELANRLDISLNEMNFGNKGYESPNNYLENLQDYLNRVRPIALELLAKHGLSQKYIVPEKEFQKRLTKIQEIKQSLGLRTSIKVSDTMDKYIKLLKYKKQIILQGPPGTGKTYTAKRVAEILTGTQSSSKELTSQIIKNRLDSLISIPNASGKINFYKITDVGDDYVELQSDKSQPWKAKHKNIIAKYDQLVKGQKPKNTNNLDPYELAVARFFFKLLKPEPIISKGSYKLVQFHPSYSYEDFVRGISAKSEGEHISYETENKTLALFALEANNNLIASQKDVEDFSKEEGIKDLLIEFAEKVQDTIDETEDYKLTEAVSIVAVEEDAFRYTGKWKTSQRMKFKDLVSAILQDVSSRQDFKRLINVSGLAKQHSTYFFKVLEQFRLEFDSQIKEAINKKLSKPQLKNYVLIIDEINRANLPSVLGELIYALEYRGEGVESMYTMDDGDATITIPENLYIIGTMNTADRSVGHIDYAIKRRFAFVDMMPDANVIGNDVAKELFNLVSELFTDDYLASDFDPKDVHLGHSYFLLDEESELSQSEQLQLKLDYEILPILNEYVKDGLLLETAKDKIKEIAEFEC